MAILKQDFLPKHLWETLQSHKVQGTVLVQACPTTTETHLLLDIAEQTEFVRAVTGWVDLSSPHLAQGMEAISHPLLRGLRHQVQDEPSPAQWLADPAVNNGVKYIQNQGYVYEILVTHHYLADAMKFAARHDQYHLVLNHFGKPNLRDGVTHWKKQIAPFSDLTHVSCKISGLLTEPRPEGMTSQDLIPWFQAALEVFGSERLMFGSDWPVCLMMSGHEENPWTLWKYATDELSSNEQAAIYGDNACMVYRIQDTSNGSVSSK